MSKWRKALKNNKRFDARYFLNERIENQEVVENSVQQEEVKRNFNNFSFDSWLAEAEEELEEMHCNSKRDDEEELEEMHCNSKRDDEEELEEMHCNSKRDDEEELEEGKGKYDDGDGKDEKCDYVDCEGAEKELEELQVHPHTAKDFSGSMVPITDEEPPVKKKKKKKEGPVDHDPPMGLEESEVEED